VNSRFRSPSAPGIPSIARLAETASGAPFFAASLVIHGTQRIRREYLEIMAVTGGDGELISRPASGEPRVHRLSRGQILMLRPIDDVQFIETSPVGVATLYVSFSDADWETFAGLVGIDPSWLTTPDIPMVTFDPGNNAALRPFDLAVQRFRDSPTALDLVQFWLGVTPVLFPALGRRHSGVGAPAWLISALEAMRDEGNLRRGLPRLLELAHVSASHLSVTVRKYFGKTPTALVTDLRLRHAARLLSTTGESVRSIAQRSGFENVTYFSTCFRRVHHLSPREYRLRARGGALGSVPESRTIDA
jgi:AraC family cel operon transcriptional repressor